VLAELGRGGMATVYLAHDIALDRKIAIKVMSPVLLSGEGMVERFKREARTAGQLSHPHIIPIYAVRQSGALLYFVMKFVEGRPLDSIIREIGPLPIPMVQTILQQVGSALGYAHRRGVIHRDIKPANIMIDADGWAVVTDFGIAKVSQTQGLTMTGATVGTPSYMSPEQCAAKELDGASDQYSLGVVAYEMLSGKLPFVAESVMAVMYAHFNEPPSPIQLARADCPPKIAAAVMRMLEKEPDRRFPNSDVAVAAIGGAPLAPDDPIRTQMMTLAAKSDSMQLLERFNTPVSRPSAMLSGSGVRPSIATLVISPARATVSAGGEVQLLVSAKARGGQTIANRPISWASTNTRVARVSPNGLVTAVGPGTVTMTASSENTSATAIITVTGRRRRRAALLGGGVALAAIGALLWVLLPGLISPRGPGTPVDTVPGAEPAPPRPDTTLGLGGPIPPARNDSPAARPRNDSTFERRPERTVPVSRDSSESTVATALASANAIRVSALAAGASDSDLGPGDAELRQAGILRQARRRAEAFAHYREAARLFAGAESVATATRVAEARRARPTRDSTQTPPPPPPPPPDPRPQIREVIAAYGRAMEGRDVDGLKRVYPGISRQKVTALQDFFENARSIQTRIEPIQIDVSGDEADVVVRGSMTFQSINPSGQQTSPLNFHARLVRQGSTWVIASLEQD
jgi:serine/threonine protein kinase